MSKFEDGDKVWSVYDGWGVVTLLDSKSYPVCVTYNNGHSCAFTVDGRLSRNSYLPTLFYDEIKPEDWPNPPKPFLRWR